MLKMPCSGLHSAAIAAFFSAALLAAPEALAKGVWKPVGFAQLTAEWGNGNNGIDFGSDRIRAGVKYDSADLFGAFVLDFSVKNAGGRTPGTLNNTIIDAWLGWKFNPQWSVKLGQMKTPIGMDFNAPAAGLDITKRGMEKPLVLDFDLGAMLSARNLPHGFGLDLGLFNPAGRSGATNYPSLQSGEDNAWAARLLWGNDHWHWQASFGSTPNAGGMGTEDYSVVNVASRAAYTGLGGLRDDALLLQVQLAYR